MGNTIQADLPEVSQLVHALVYFCVFVHMEKRLKYSLVVNSAYVVC